MSSVVQPLEVPKAIFGAALTVFLVLSWRSVSAPETWLVQAVPDDAFYYLVIAQHLVDSGRSTADGFVVTNGYHPLWMAIVAMLASVASGWTLVRAVVAVSFALYLLAALVLRRVVASIMDQAAGWIGAAVWLVCPLGYLLALQATEGTAYMTTLFVVLGVHLSCARLWRQEVCPPQRTFVFYGLALGLACLARTGAVTFAATAVLWMVYRALRFSQPREAFRRALLAPVACGVVVMPWLLFSAWQVGTIVQDSAATKALWLADQFPDVAGRSRNIVETAGFIARDSAGFMLAPKLSTTLAMPVVGLVVLGAALILVRRRRTDAASAMGALTLAMLAMTVVYGLTVSERQVWWLGPPLVAGVVAAVLLGAMAFEALRGRPWLRATGAAVVTLAGVVNVVGWHSSMSPLYPWQLDVYNSQSALEAMVPASARIGSFNAGIPMFFGSERVVALDGLVSHDARVASEEGRFDQFLVDHCVAFIADEERALERALRYARRRPSLVERASYPLTDWPTGRRVLWEVGLTD